MDKKSRLILLAAVVLVGLVALAWAWYEPSPKVDPTIVQAAAESARASATQEPPTPEAPVVKGRARPGSLGGPTP